MDGAKLGWITSEEAAYYFTLLNKKSLPAACSSSIGYAKHVSAVPPSKKEAEFSRAAIERISTMVSEKDAITLWDVRANTPDLVAEIVPGIDAENACAIAREVTQRKPVSP